MKKYILSSFVVISFIVYSFYQRAFAMQTTNISQNSQSNAKIPVSPTPQPTDLPTPTALVTIKPITQSTAQPQDTPIPTATPTPKPQSEYKDGNFTGDAADADYGNIQVQASISNGKLTAVQFLQYPNDRGRSIEINQQADPLLAQEAISAQNSQVDIVSGATDSSRAFIQSLQSALDKARS